MSGAPSMSVLKSTRYLRAHGRAHGRAAAAAEAHACMPARQSGSVALHARRAACANASARAGARAPGLEDHERHRRVRQRDDAQREDGQLLHLARGARARGRAHAAARGMLAGRGTRGRGAARGRRRGGLGADVHVDAPAG